VQEDNQSRNIAGDIAEFEKEITLLVELQAQHAEEL
jgi:hypothetical protein